MAKETSIEHLFKEHSFEEIESVRDNLANEIEKRTELLKSIVKEKYRDIVDTSDAIQSMKINLKEVEQSLWSLDKNISDFCATVKEPQVSSVRFSASDHVELSSGDEHSGHCDSDIVRKLLSYSTEIWDHFDAGDLKTSYKLVMDAMAALELGKTCTSPEHQTVIHNLGTTLKRSNEMIKNNLWHRVQTAAPDQIGIVAGSDQEDLFRLGFEASIGFLVDQLRRDLCDTTYHAQIRRFQDRSYFDTRTNQINPQMDEFKFPSSDYIQLPKHISPELSAFLYNICKVINTIAGFNLSRPSVVESLGITLNHTIDVYSFVATDMDQLKAEAKRKRALQLYFDLLYLRVLLNHSKSVELIERMDSRVHELAGQYEAMLDPIELYAISNSLHTNVMSLSRSTIRLYGLLVPHLQ